MVEKKQVRLLFLDFDGVLINAESLRRDTIEAVKVGNLADDGRLHATGL
jgi:3-deoxy-D-manno-octulosonate 8-phosphate phosphatase KdsC-like HAD superfamily phosphatase